MIEPPAKLSELIELALNDIDKCAADPRYTIDMYVWHRPLDGTCHVCLAGSVIAQTFRKHPMEFIYAEEFGPAWKRAFYALDAVREGRLAQALDEFGVKQIPRQITEDYYSSPFGDDEWRENVDWCLKTLKKYNL